MFFRLTVVAALILIIPSPFAGEQSNVQEDALQLFNERLSIGGELRLRGELKDGFKFDSSNKKDNDEILLFRSRVHFDARPFENFRAYLEFQDAREFESELLHDEDVPNGYVDSFDIRQAFLEFNVNHFMLRAGRQPLKFGSQRLLGDPNWSNVGRTYEALRVGYYHDAMNVDVFVGQPVMIDNDNFNTASDSGPSTVDDNTLYGVYSTFSDVVFDHDELDAYFLLRDNSNEDSSVYTIGARYLNVFDNGWDTDGEFAYQFGDYEGLDHQAFALHVGGGYTFHYDWHPRVGLFYNFASGDDDSSDNDHGTFDNLFPTNHKHYGYMDFFSWRNMHQVAVTGSVKPMKKLKLFSQLSVFWLHEEDDDIWYKSNGGKLRSAKGFGDVRPFAGTELDLKVQYQATKYFALEAGYSHFFTGGYISDTGADDDADKVYFIGTLTF